MRPSEPGEDRSFDWRSWLALAWVVGVGLLYALMLLREKAPGLLARLNLP